MCFWAWRAAVVSSSPERLDPNSRRREVGKPPITDELTSVLAFHGQHAFALGTVIALPESRPDLGERWSSRLVATAAEDRLSFRRKSRASFAPAIAEAIAIYEYTP